MNIFSILGIICSLSGYWFVNNKKIAGYYIWQIGNIFWLIHYYRTKDIASIIVFACYVLITFHGIWKWKKGVKND